MTSAPGSSTPDSDPVAVRALSGTVLSSVISALPAFLVAGLAVQIGQALRFDATGLGGLVSLYYLAAAVAAVPLSRASTVIGPLRVMRLGCVIMAALLVILAGLVHSVPWLALVMVAAGTVSAAIQPATNLFLVRRIPRRRQGLAFGVKQAAVPVSVMLGGLSVPVIGVTVGWRWAFVGVAAMAVCTSVLLPRSRTSLASHRARQTAARLPRAVRMRLVGLTCGFSAGVAAANALSSFAVVSSVAVGYDPAVAGLLAGLGGLSAALTRVILGLRADRSNQSHLDVVVWMLAAGTVGYVILALSSALPAALLLSGTVLAFSFGWGWNGLFNLAISTKYPAQAAQATGITSVGGRAGGVIGPAAFGFVADHASYDYAWLLASLLAAAGTVIIFIARRGWSTPVKPAE